MRGGRACNYGRGKRTGQPFIVFRLQKSTQTSEATDPKAPATADGGKVVTRWWWWSGRRRRRGGGGWEGRSGSVVGGGVSVVNNCRARVTKDQSTPWTMLQRTGGQRRCGGRIAGLEKKDCKGIAGLDSSDADDVKRKSSDTDGKHTGTSFSVATTNRFLSHLNRESV